MIATAVLVGFTAYRTAFPTVRADGTIGAPSTCATTGGCSR